MNKIGGVLPYLDWFMPSLEEARELSGKDSPPEIADIFVKKGVKNIVIKLGADGCYVCPQSGVCFTVPAYKVSSVVDTSGAGDAFCAGFLTGLLNKWDFRQCAEFANAVAAHCVMAIGTTTGIKPMSKIIQFIAENKLA